jgi:predicted dithiol-disulfide oxidoreductase (DUF899 family)
MAHRVVSNEEWLAARRGLLVREKELSRLRDELSRARRELPWEALTREYVFDGPGGSQTLSQLFGESSQLIVYHFMFAPGWDAGCPDCSFWADNFNGIPAHLRARDVAFAAVSRAPYEQLAAYHKRMGWSFNWVSSFGSEFNFDYHVSFTEDMITSKTALVNYEPGDPGGAEHPGISVFARDESGAVYHTYSAYSRGLDMMNAAYHYLDLVPKGRDETRHDDPMFWVRRHDEY